MEADERLVVMLEARITEFEKRMRQAEQRGTRTYTGLRRSSSSATAAMEADAARAAARVNQSLASVSSRIGDFGKAFAGGLLAGGAAALVSQLGAASRQAVADLAALGDTARRANLEVEDFQRWAFVASQNRIGLDAMTDGFKELSLRADEFIQTGAGPAAEAFNRLGLGAAELRDRLKEPSALMLEIVGRLEGMDKAAQVRIADEVFGGTGGERFVELLAQGEEGLRATMARAEEVGVVLDREMIQKAAELDAKFRELESRLAAVWQTGAVQAGYFFGLVEREREKLALNPAGAAQVVGEGLTGALSDLPEVPQEALEQIEGLRLEYQALAEEARGLVLPLSDASAMLRGLGEEAGAVALADLSRRLSDAAAAFDDGTMTGEEYATTLRDVMGEAEKTLAALDDLDRAKLEGVIGQVSSLLDWIRQLPQAAADARAEVAALALMDTGQGLSPEDPGLLPPEPRSPLAPSRSQRPRRAPAMLGEREPAKTGGRAGGGGKPANRVEALLADLQTEREAVAAWYEESAAMLQAATDAELAQIGGRQEAVERLEAEHMARLRAIRGGGQGQMLDEAAGFFGAMAGIAAAGGDRLVKAVATFSAVQSLINSYTAATAALATPGLTVWGRVAAYASVLGTGLQAVAAIKSAGGVGGGSAGGIASGATSSASAADVSTPAKVSQAPMRVRLEMLDPRAIFTGQALIDLVDDVQREVGNRGVIWETGR